jgi:hypothetical protein
MTLRNDTRLVLALMAIPMTLGIALGFRGAAARPQGAPAPAATVAAPDTMLAGLARAQPFRARRVSSYDPSGANADGRQDRPIAPGETRTLAAIEGPGAIHHVWVTIASPEAHHLRSLVLRIYWDGEATPSILCPIGDFFGTGHGEYTPFVSLPMAIGQQKALNCFWYMPFAKGAKITVENQGGQPVGAFYYYVDYREFPDAAAVAGQGRFHAHYRQQAPTDGSKAPGQDQFSKAVNGTPNADGKGNYTIMEAEGRGTYLGVVHHVVQGDDQWWGEGDDMIFLDGDARPTLHGTGSEDYYAGAWCFGKPYAYPFFGNPRNAWRPEDGDSPPCDQRVPMHRKGAKWTVYRLHLADPIPFETSIRATIEHGHANSRSDDVSTTAYWYQFDRKAPLPELPPLPVRIGAPRP